MKILKQTILKVLFLSVFLSANVPSLFGMQNNGEGKIDFTKILPGELSLMIFEFLSPEDLAKTSQASKYWNELSNDWQVWQAVMEKNSFGSTEKSINLFANILIHKAKFWDEDVQLKQYLLDYFLNPEKILNEQLGLKIDIENDLPDDFSQILPNYVAASWKNINLKDEWRKLNDKISQIKEKLKQNTSTQSDSDNLNDLRNAKIMFVAIAYVNEKKDINWNDFDWNEFPPDSLFTYALKVLKSNEYEFRKVRNQLFNNNLDNNNNSRINLGFEKLTNTKLAVLFPLILINNKNTNLEWFSLCYNELTYVPESIGDLTNLISLCLDNNKLKKLPKSIENLTDLWNLSLENNDGKVKIPNTLSPILDITGSYQSVDPKEL